MNTHISSRRVAAALSLLLFVAGCGTETATDEPGQTGTTTSVMADTSIVDDAMNMDDIGAEDNSDHGHGDSIDVPEDSAMDDGDSMTDVDRVVMITVADGSVSTASERVEVALGSTVGLMITSDISDEVHVHGFNVHADVEPGSPAELRFTADVPGLFEVELEKSGLFLIELEVS